MSRVVVTGKVPDAALEKLRAEHEVDAWTGPESISREELLRRVAGADAIVSLLTERIDGELLDAAGPQLKVVSNVAVGYDNIDVPACTGRGIVATNTPGVLTEATADIAFGLILMATRRLGEGERLIRAGQPWKWGMFFLLGSSLQGKTLGVVGMGGIGQATARRAKAFGMDIVYQSRSEIDPAIAAELGARRVDLDELLTVSDVVSLHCPYGPNTHHLIGAEQLAAMKSSTYLVNTARGPIVDEAALAAALREGVIAGAGLDVFEHEPQVHPELLDLENVTLVPHLGSATVETRTAMAVLAADNTLAVLRGGQPPTPIG
ncbi:glyoxylate reductase [Arthrobacter globiformis NBRC 12137]|uniref:Glyoxylate reductase n=1 Tax=Arthrobacter globiformis (strain ATCC 8010 / DSM 20124 / JCM 1332 / NBRC 12137 / NCIMB 8907 / NRRL B-2979 / 168) TaxID=1077972 RepID=H0QPI5_ARTG1|nr:D-glycerate dehydrogenase [Arthrobacter globiformis]GAB14736.1 glyoxylate reductase [Arthrobacter globiformis NBRC 12137]